MDIDILKMMGFKQSEQEIYSIGSDIIDAILKDDTPYYHIPIDDSKPRLDLKCATCTSEIISEIEGRVPMESVEDLLHSNQDEEIQL